MNTPEQRAKQLAIEALQQVRGDDYERAGRRFSRMSEVELDQPYGGSESTPRQILAEYAVRAARYDAAIEWLSTQP